MKTQTLSNNVTTPRPFSGRLADQTTHKSTGGGLALGARHNP